MLARSFRPVLVRAQQGAPQNGIVDLPPGKIAAIATYLERRVPPEDGPPFTGELRSIGGDVARYRALYSRIGEPWLWFTRAVLTDEALRQIISHRDVEVLALVHDGRDVAMIELDFRHPGECELVFFGLVREYCGRGVGRPLLREAMRRAFMRPITRMWLHTCTLDHPAAPALYIKSGFVPYRRAIEIADDPRLSGHLPRDAAPGFPPL